MFQNAFSKLMLAAPILMLSSLLVAQPTPIPLPGPPRPAPPSPKPVQSKQGLEFEETAKDFGKAEEGEKVTIKFPFTNNSEETITITDVRSSCGCTAAAPDKKVFEPGEGGEITANFNTSGRIGRQHKVITLTTNEHVYQLRLEGDVITDVYLQPRTLNFGNIDQGEGVTRKIKFVNFTDQDINIVSAKISRDDIEVEVGEKEEFTEGDRKGTATPISVTLPDTFPEGRLSTALTLRTDAEEGRQTYTVIVRGDILGDITVQPMTMAFAVLEPGETKSRNGQVIVRGEDPFELDSYSIEIDSIAGRTDEVTTPSVEVEVGERRPNSNAQPLEITLEAPDTFGHMRGQIVMVGKIGEEETKVPVPFTVFVRKEQPQVRTGAAVQQQQNIDRAKVMKLIEQARESKEE